MCLIYFYLVKQTFKSNHKENLEDTFRFIKPYRTPVYRCTIPVRSYEMGVRWSYTTKVGNKKYKIILFDSSMFFSIVEKLNISAIYNSIILIFSANLLLSSSRKFKSTNQMLFSNLMLFSISRTHRLRTLKLKFNNIVSLI